MGDNTTICKLCSEQTLDETTYCQRCHENLEDLRMHDEQKESTNDGLERVLKSLDNIINTVNHINKNIRDLNNSLGIKTANTEGENNE